MSHLYPPFHFLYATVSTNARNHSYFFLANPVFLKQMTVPSHSNERLGDTLPSQQVGVEKGTRLHQSENGTSPIQSE